MPVLPLIKFDGYEVWFESYIAGLKAAQANIEGHAQEIVKNVVNAKSSIARQGRRVKKKSNEPIYGTKDILTFVRRDEVKGEHIVKVNKSKEFGVPYLSSALLLLMAIALKKNGGGWVTKEQFKNEGFVKGEESVLADRLYSLVFKLRSIFRGKVNHPGFIYREKDI